MLLTNDQIEQLHTIANTLTTPNELLLLLNDTDEINRKNDFYIRVTLEITVQNNHYEHTKKILSLCHSAKDQIRIINIEINKLNLLQVAAKSSSHEIMAMLLTVFPAHERLNIIEPHNRGGTITWLANYYSPHLLITILKHLSPNERASALFGCMGPQLMFKINYQLLPKLISLLPGEYRDLPLIQLNNSLGTMNTLIHQLVTDHPDLVIPILTLLPKTNLYKLMNDTRFKGKTVLQFIVETSDVAFAKNLLALLFSEEDQLKILSKKHHATIKNILLSNAIPLSQEMASHLSTITKTIAPLASGNITTLGIFTQQKSINDPIISVSHAKSR